MSGAVCFEELHGDYTFSTRQIRLWSLTAVRGRAIAYRSVVSTLLHEFCHHLDASVFGYSYHTRGFYARLDDLYYALLAIPESERRPLEWYQIRRGVWTRVMPTFARPRKSAKGASRRH